MNSTEEFGRITNSTDLICSLGNTDLTHILKLAAIVIVGGFGILNNVFIIVLAFKYTTVKNLHHLIINKAVADTLIILITLCFEVPLIFDHFLWVNAKIIFGDLICKIYTFLLFTSILATTTSLVIISIERFRASSKTVQISQPYTLKQRLAVVGFSWFISGAFAAHQWPYRTIEEVFSGFYACRGYTKIPLALAIFVYSTLFVFFCGSILLNAVTLRRLSRRHEIETSLSELQRKVRAKRISGAVKMVLSSFFLFCFCYLPFLLWILIKQFAKETITYHLVYCYDAHIFDFLTAFLPLVNSCFSPVIYLTFLSDFSKAAKAVVCRGSLEQT